MKSLAIVSLLLIILESVYSANVRSFASLFLSDVNTNQNNVSAVNTTTLNNTATNTTLLYSINFIATPHYFPDSGLDVNNQDPFGNVYNSTVLPGQLTDFGINQTARIAQEISSSFKNYTNVTLHKEEI